MPVWRPFRDHSVSPWRTTKTRGVVIGIVRWGEVFLRLVCCCDAECSAETEVKQILDAASDGRGVRGGGLKRAGSERQGRREMRVLTAVYSNCKTLSWQTIKD